MRTQTIITTAAALALLFLAPAAQAHAQSGMISIQPISAVFGVYNVEAEFALGTNVSFGASGTYWGFEEDTQRSSGSAEVGVSYISADLKARYYPDAALDGFSIGALVGTTSISGNASACVEDPNSGTSCDEAEGREWALSAGVELDYTFRLGDTGNFAVILGLGGKRLFPLGGDIETLLGYPFGRLSVGYAF